MASPTLSYLDRAPSNKQPPTSVVFLLHGYGAEASDLITLAEAWQQELPNTLFIAPNAPTVCNHLPSGRQWFALYDVSLPVLIEGAQQASTQLASFIESVLLEKKLQDLPVAILGFSQGAMTAMYTALRMTKPVQAVLAYSGLLLGTENLGQEITARPPILLIHGKDDTVVPHQATLAAAEALDQHQVPVKLLVLDALGHGIDDRGLAAGAQFLVEHLYPKAAA
jgi:phospholipase/carboxylesterase